MEQITDPNILAQLNDPSLGSVPSMEQLEEDKRRQDEENNWSVIDEIGRGLNTAGGEMLAGIHSGVGAVQHALGFEEASNYSRKRAQNANAWAQQNAPKTILGDAVNMGTQVVPYLMGGPEALLAKTAFGGGMSVGQNANEQTIANKEYELGHDVRNAAITTALGAGLGKTLAPVSNKLLGRMADNAGQAVLENMGTNEVAGRSLGENNVQAALAGAFMGEGIRGVDKLSGIRWNQSAVKAAETAGKLRKEHPNMSDTELEDFVSHQKLTGDFYANKDKMSDEEYAAMKQHKRDFADKSTGASAHAMSTEALEKAGFKGTALSMNADYGKSLGDYNNPENLSRLGDIYGVAPEKAADVQEALGAAKPLTKGQRTDDSVRTTDKHYEEVQKSASSFKSNSRNNLIDSNKAVVGTEQARLKSELDNAELSGDKQKADIIRNQQADLRELNSLLGSLDTVIHNAGQSKPNISEKYVEQLGSDIDDVTRRLGISDKMTGFNGQKGLFDPVTGVHSYMDGIKQLDAEFPQWRNAQPNSLKEAGAVSMSAGEQVAHTVGGLSSMGATLPLTGGRVGLQAFQARRARKKLARAEETQALARKAKQTQFKDALASGDGEGATASAVENLESQGIEVPQTPVQKVVDTVKSTIDSINPLKRSKVEEKSDELVDNINTEVEEAQVKADEQAAKEAESEFKRSGEKVGPKPKAEEKAPVEAPKSKSEPIRPKSAEVTAREEARKKAEQEKAEEVKAEEAKVEEVKTQEAAKEKRESNTEDTKGRAKTVKKPEPKVEVKEEPVAEKPKPLPLQPRGLKEAPKGHELVPTDIAYNRAATNMHKKEIMKWKNSLNTDTNTVQEAYNTLYENLGHKPTFDEIKSKVVADRKIAADRKAAEADAEAKTFLDEQVSVEEEAARQAEIDKAEADDLARNDRVNEAKREVADYIKDYDIDVKHVNGALRAMGQRPGDYIDAKTGEPIDVIKLNTKINQLATAEQRKVDQAARRNLTKMNQAVNRASTARRALQRKAEREANAEKKEKLKEQVFTQQMQDFAAHAEKMHPAVRKEAKKFVDTSFKSLTKLSEAKENSMWRKLDKMEQEKVQELSDNVQSRIETEQQVLKNFVEAQKPTPQDVINKQTKKISDLLTEQKDLNKTITGLENELSKVDGKVEAASKKAVKEAEKLRKLEEKGNELNLNAEAIEAQRETVTEDIEKITKDMDYVKQDEIDEYINDLFYHLDKPHSNMNKVYNQAKTHFEKLEAKRNKDTEANKDFKKAVSEKDVYGREALATAIVDRMDAAIAAADTAQIERLNKMTNYLNEATGTKKTRTERGLANAKAEVARRKKKYPDNPERWITSEMVTSLQSAIKGFDSGSSYAGNLKRRLLSSVFPDPDNWKDYQFAARTHDKALDDGTAKIRQKVYVG